MYKKGPAFYSGNMKRPQGTQMLYLKARPSAAVCGGDKMGVCGVGQCGSCVLAGMNCPGTQASRVGHGGLDECPPAGGGVPILTFLFFPQTWTSVHSALTTALRPRPAIISGVASAACASSALQTTSVSPKRECPCLALGRGSPRASLRLPAFTPPLHRS